MGKHQCLVLVTRRNNVHQSCKGGSWAAWRSIGGHPPIGLHRELIGGEREVGEPLEGTRWISVHLCMLAEVAACPAHLVSLFEVGTGNQAVHHSPKILQLLQCRVDR